jgi:MFS family permease
MTVVVVCLLLMMVEGFDLLVMAFAASGVAREFGLNGAQVGLLLSSSLAGMALGSACLAPLADRIGRRPLTVACLALSTVGMSLAAVSAAFTSLGLARILTGIGIGGMIASLPCSWLSTHPAAGAPPSSRCTRWGCRWAAWSAVRWPPC